MIGLRDELRIGTLRARGEAMPTPSQRLSLERALERAELMPAGIPPDAVLLVRHLRQSIPTEARHGRHDTAWACAVRDRLAQCYSTALVPQRGRVPADAEAIVFADRAELLAALARDLMEGVAWRQWWWRALLGRWRGELGPAAVATTMLVEDAERLPAVLAALHGWGDVGAFLRSLGPDGVQTLLAALAETFELTRIAEALRGIGRQQATRADCSERDQDGGMIGPRRDDSSTDAAEPADGFAGTDAEGATSLASGTGRSHEPAREDATSEVRRVAALARTLPRDLSGGAALLLGLSLSLVREPWHARGTEFQAAALSHWYSWQPVGAEETTTLDASSDDRSRAVVRPDATGERSARDTVAGELDRSDTKTDAAGNSAPSRSHPAVNESEAKAPARTDASSGSEGGSGRADEAAPATYRDAEGLTTDLGGVLYLVNLMKALELPECFEDDWSLRSRLGPWALLELLARALLDQSIYRYRHDPLWAALARLGGREPHEPIGEGFVGSPAYRIPPTWPDPLHDDEPRYCWASAGGRLRLWNEAGWMLAEVLRGSGSPGEQARRELADAGIERVAPLRRAAFAAGPIAAGTWSNSASCDRLLALMLPYLRLRLLTALDSGSDDPDALADLLRLRARLYVTSSHVDLVARMDDISLAARRAGLDRDPGWLPPFGRVLLFHFE